MAIASSIHSIEELLRAGATGTLLVSRKGDRRKQLARDAERSGCSVRHVTDDEIRRVVQRDDHAGVAFTYEAPTQSRPKLDVESFLAENEQETDLLIVILDGITDPQNVGAILRTADKFEVAAVVCGKRRSAGMGDTVHRVSSGASAYVPLIEVVNVHRAIQMLQEKGFWVYGADVDGRAIGEYQFDGRIAIILGSEGGGMSRLSRERCDGLLMIPCGGHIDSFNVSVAAGIILYEITRGRFT